MISNGNQADPPQPEANPVDLMAQTRIDGVQILEEKPTPETPPTPAPDVQEAEETVIFDPVSGMSIGGTNRQVSPKRPSAPVPVSDSQESEDGEGEEEGDGDTQTPRTTARIRFLVLVVVLIGVATLVTRCPRGGSDGTVVPLVNNSPAAAPAGDSSPTPPPLPNIPEDLKPKNTATPTEVNQDLQVRNQALIKALKYANQNFLDLVAVRRNWFVDAWKRQNQKTGIPFESFLLIELARQNQWHYEVFDSLRQSVMKDILTQQKAGAPIYDVQPMELAGSGDKQDLARPMSIDALCLMQLLTEEWLKNGSFIVADDQTGSIKVDEFNTDPAFGWLRDPDRQNVVASKPASMIAQMRVIANAAWRVRSLNSDEEKVSNEYAKQRLLPSPSPAVPAPTKTGKNPGKLPK